MKISNCYNGMYESFEVEEVIGNQCSNLPEKERNEIIEEFLSSWEDVELEFDWNGKELVLEKVNGIEVTVK